MHYHVTSVFTHCECARSHKTCATLRCKRKKHLNSVICILRIVFTGAKVVLTTAATNVHRLQRPLQGNQQIPSNAKLPTILLLIYLCWKWCISLSISNKTASQSKVKHLYVQNMSLKNPTLEMDEKPFQQASLVLRAFFLFIHFSASPKRFD